MSPFQLAMLAEQERVEMNLGKSEDDWFVGPIKPKVAAAMEKLVPNLHDKTEYTLHYRNLQLYLALGEYYSVRFCLINFKYYNSQSHITNVTMCRSW